MRLLPSKEPDLEEDHDNISLVQTCHVTESENLMLITRTHLMKQGLPREEVGV